ncbi:MAG: CcmD family protein [Salinivenus sp.]
MTVHPLSASDPAPPLRPQQERPDSSTAYDTTWTEQSDAQPLEGLERVMLPDGKIYVVLAVVLIIWLGVVTILYRTDRRIDRLERRLDQDIPEDPA